MREYKYGVFIGRFQPIHSSHLKIIEKGLELADNFIIIVGSTAQARSTRNPFTFDERKLMIESAISEDLDPKFLDRVFIVPMKDFFYNDNIWTTNVQKLIKEIVGDESRILMLGSYKDSQSYWLNLFPQWDFKALKTDALDASSIRKSYFESCDKENSKKWTDHQIEFNIPLGIRQFLINFAKTKQFESLKNEYDYVEKYKKAWSVAPFPPTFVTVDCVVICSGHVLVVKRGHNPGVGTFAIPGGFLNQDERIEDGALRELKEETGIKVSKLILKGSIVESKVFDHPQRSTRGRTITHCYCLNLKLIDGEMPVIKSGSDASEVKWMEFSEVYDNQDKFYEDHFHIITHFINKNY